MRILCRSLGPFNAVDMELKRLNFVFGAVGSGKSFLFRLLTLAHMSMDVAELRSEEIYTAFARLVLSDDGMVSEALTLGKNFVESIATSMLLKRDNKEGELKLYVDAEPVIELHISRNPKNGRYIEMSINKEVLQNIVLIHIPQERPVNIVAELLRSAGREYLDFVDKYGPVLAVHLLLNKLMFSYSPILAKFVVDLAAAIGYIRQIEKSDTVVIDIEGAEKRRLKLELRTVEGRTTLYDEGTNVSISTPSMLRAPMGSLEAGFVKTVIKGLRYFLENNHESKALLIIDEFGEHCDPVLVQKLLDHVVKTTVEQENLYTVIITHNPDVLTRSLRVLETYVQSQPGIEKMCAIHRFVWMPDKQCVEVRTATLEVVDGALKPSEPIEVLEEAFEYLTT